LCRGINGACKIGAFFARSKHLFHLDLSRNEKVGCQGISSLCTAAKESVGGSCIPFSALKLLNLSECNISAPGVKSLSECLGERDSNHERCNRFDLNLSSNSIGAEGCEYIKVMLSKPSMGSVLSKLKLSQCAIEDAGISTISAAAKVSPCTGLTVLDVSDNSITHVGAGSFAESLAKSWPDLAELNFSKNNIGSAGVVILMKCLRQRSDIANDHPVISNETVMVMKSILQGIEAGSDLNDSLKSLDLTETNCGIEGASAALMSGELTILRLFNNKLGSDGFYSISKLLQGGHPSIQHLDLGGNSADETSVVALLDAIANAHGDIDNKLSVLEIGGNEFGDEADAALKRMKKVWPKLDVAHDKPVQREVIEE
jgi:Leucine-rich repeat (LRR) protein